MTSGHTPQPKPEARVGDDREWAGDARAAVGCAGLLLAVSLAVDAGDDGLSLLGTCLWIGLSALFFVVLLPARAAVEPGRLTVRGLWTRTVVRTDRLAAVRWPDGIEQRLVLTDTDGVEAHVDVRVLLANPALWLILEADARKSHVNGTLSAVGDLDRLARHVERHTARSVFTVSGLR
ncbi:hypothetical protein ACWFR1_33545 [Streptomyces sp. NPDC055103]